MLRHVNLKNTETATKFGQLKFDEKGECRQLTAEQEQEFAKVRGFEVVEEKVEEPKKPAPKKQAKKDEIVEE